MNIFSSIKNSFGLSLLTAISYNLYSIMITKKVSGDIGELALYFVLAICSLIAVSSFLPMQVGGIVQKSFTSDSVSKDQLIDIFRYYFKRFLAFVILILFVNFLYDYLLGMFMDHFRPIPLIFGYVLFGITMVIRSLIVFWSIIGILGMIIEDISIMETFSKTIQTIVENKTASIIIIVINFALLFLTVFSVILISTIPQYMNIPKDMFLYPGVILKSISLAVFLNIAISFSVSQYKKIHQL